MKKAAFMIFIFLMAVGVAADLSAAQRAFKVQLRGFGGSGGAVPLYSDYFALLIGCSRYHNGWPKLPNPVRDIRDVSRALKSLGFKVELIEDPSGVELRHVLNALVTGPGRDPNMGIFVFFAGHGSTLTRFDGSKLGYIVPVDAPDPDRDPTGFMNLSVSMREIEEICTLIRSKHVLMAFDSCFSGTIFRSAFTKPSQYIKDQLLEPVRAFIAAGNENERVPDESVFKTCLIQGLADGYADLNKDGYVTGDELGLYLKEEVINYSEGTQHPHYGKIKNPNLDKGDFVFKLASSSGATIERPKRVYDENVLKVTSNVNGSEVFVDGMKTGIAPLLIKRLSPGSHSLRVTAPGYEPYERRVSISPGRSLTVEVILEAVSNSVLEISGNPKGAEVAIDGNFAGVVPVTLSGISSGSHRVGVMKEGYEQWSRTVQFNSGETKSITVNLKHQAPAVFEAATFTNRLGMRFVKIPAGNFMMGSGTSASVVADRYGGKAAWYEREHPQHHEVIHKPFFMQTTEVTQKQWVQVMGNNPAKFQNCGENCPVEQVLWDDVREFIRRLNLLEKTTQYRLPTEAEWEYACRGGSATSFCFGNDPGKLGDYAWYSDNSSFGTSPVGEKRANAWGLHDMHGNVWEWCDEWFNAYGQKDENQEKAPTDTSSTLENPPHMFDPNRKLGGDAVGSVSAKRKNAAASTAATTHRVVRGGSWNNSAGSCRSAYRDMRDPGSWGYSLGFRLVRDP